MNTTTNKPGELIKITYKAGKGRTETREGKVLNNYDKFICVWIYSKSQKSIGWRECFLYTDILNGIIKFKEMKEPGRAAI